MGWLSSLLFPCTQARKPIKDSCSISSSPREKSNTFNEQENVSLSIDPAFFPQKPNKLAKKPSSQTQATSSIRIVEYPDSASMLDEAADEKNDRVLNSCAADAESILSDDRTILMPEPDEEAVLMEMGKIEKELAAATSTKMPSTATMTTATPIRLTSLSMSMPTSRRSSLTTTRTSACLDMPALDWSRITGAIQEEPESEEMLATQDNVASTAAALQENEGSEATETTEKLDYEAPTEHQDPEQQAQEQQEHREYELGHDKEQEQEQEQEQSKTRGPEPASQPRPQPQLQAQPQAQSQPYQEPQPYKKEQDHHFSTLSTRLSRRRSFIEIFNMLHTNERSSFKLRFDFSPRLYPSPLSPTSPSSSTTAVSPPMSPVSSILPLSPTLSDETIKVNGIETACAVQMVGPGRKGAEEDDHQENSIHDIEEEGLGFYCE